MSWTTEHPRESGWYWVRVAAEGAPHVLGEPYLLLLEAGNKIPWNRGTLFAGPVSPPPAPPVASHPRPSYLSSEEFREAVERFYRAVKQIQQTTRRFRREWDKPW